MAVKLRPGTPAEAYQVSRLIPEFTFPYPESEFQKRLADHPSFVLIAEVGGSNVGFKAGYALDQNVFYSWMGGVIPGYRRSGIAQGLMEAQEAWVRAHGYHAIQVKTRNRHRGMRALLLLNGYDVIGFQPGENVGEHRIVFSKSL